MIDLRPLARLGCLRKCQEICGSSSDTGTCINLHTTSWSPDLDPLPPKMALEQSISSSRHSAHRTEALLSQRTGSYFPEHPQVQHCAGPWRELRELVSLQTSLASWQHACLELSIIGPAAIHGFEPGLLQCRLRLKCFHVVL